MSTSTSNKIAWGSWGGLLLGLVIAACGGNEANDDGVETDPPSCEHGSFSPCVCTDGSMGTQMCAHDSSGFEACVCTGDETSGTTSAATSTSDSGSTSSMASTTAPADGTTSSTGPDPGTETATTEDTGPVGAPPMAQINHPGDGEDRVVDVPIPFIGVANDAEDGPLAGASMVWTSDVQGQLGEGEAFDAALTTLGMHVITLAATDSDGNVGEDSITINVVP